MENSAKELLKKLFSWEVLKGLFFGVAVTAMMIFLYILFVLLEGGVCD